VVAVGVGVVVVVVVEVEVVVAVQVGLETGSPDARRRSLLSRYMGGMDPVRLLVVGDDPLARAGLSARLAGRTDVAIAGESAPDEAFTAASALAAAVLLWDLGTSPGAELLGSRGAPPAVALAASEAKAAEAIRAGARGVLFRNASAEAIAAAAVAAARGLSVVDPALAVEWLRPPDAAPAEGLTPREAEVLGLLAEGLSNTGIAARLGISEHTAKFHVNAILGKLGADSRAAAIVKAARLGLVAL
jgi:DNA-binding NarL/FixJ family response regulator